MRRGFKGGSHHIVVGPLFDLSDMEDDPYSEDLWYLGSRIGVEHFDHAPRVIETAQYKIDKQGVRIK